MENNMDNQEVLVEEATVIFAEIDGNMQQFGGTCPEGWVQVATARPEDDTYKATAEGTWVATQQPIEKCYCALTQKTKEHYNSGMLISVLNADNTVNHTFTIQTDKESLGMMAAYTTETVINGMIDVEWEFEDGTFKTFLVQDFKKLFNIVTKYMRGCYARKRALKEALEAAEDPTTVDLDMDWEPAIGSYTGSTL